MMAGIRIAWAVLGTVFAASAAVACSCLPPPPPKAAMEKSAAVFSGKVTAIEEKAGMKLVTIAVQDQWKGNLKKEVTVKTAIQSATCGFPFQPNQKYLVYAYQQNGGAKGELGTNLCTRTCPLERAKEDLKELGPPAPNP